MPEPPTTRHPTAPASGRSGVRTAAELRRSFVEYFQARGHAFVPSSPVIPHGDPTLLFANAGMNQFKDVFLGRGTRDYARAVNAQKCIRAGGKHNDLEDVGRDSYHHTFFEMLGNWSFGDYFKKDAIDWAWDLLVNVWGLDPERLHATYFQGDEANGLEPDEEAKTLWSRHLPPERIHPGDAKDNFWEMGETGPCGPSSEIHYDFTEDRSGGPLVNAGDERVMEIWNLVFIQFNRGEDGRLAPLPAKHVDTGMGLERVARVVQGVGGNYETDLFTPIFERIRDVTGARAYGGSFEDPVDVAYRVIADHARCLTVAIADGGQPSNEGRGYVLRRILRRAVRHAHQTLKTEGPVLHEVVPAVVATLGDAYPELKKHEARAKQVIRDEEEAFLRTIDRGLVLLREASIRAVARAIADVRSTEVEHISFNHYSGHLPDGRTAEPNRAAVFFKSGDTISLLLDNPMIEAADFGLAGAPTISAEDTFRLHDTFGFPIDLTQVMAEERGLRVDLAGYERLMEEARERSRAGGDDATDTLALPPDAIARLKHMDVEPTEDSPKYGGKPITAEILAIWNGRDFDQETTSNTTLGIILDRTNFYAEAGGQVGDRGTIRVTGRGVDLNWRSDPAAVPDTGGRFEVRDTQRFGDYVLHVGEVGSGELEVGDKVEVTVEAEHRFPTRSHHTGTHLLNWALREVLGEEVEQKGSLVAPDRLRFDFALSRPMTLKEVNAVERLANAVIHREVPVHADTVPLEMARRIEGVRAVFGERYPDPVRVVCVGAPIEELVRDPRSRRWREHSIEFCGGTHLANTADLRRMVILQETGLAAGVRRITAVTGPAALAAHEAGKELESRAARARAIEDDDAFLGEVEEISRLREELPIGAVARAEIDRRLEPLRERAKSVRKSMQSSAREGVVEQAREFAAATKGRVLVEEVLGGSDADTLRSGLDAIRAKRPDLAAMLLSADEDAGKVAIVAAVPEELIGKGLKAGDWVRVAAQACGGGGGGRPDMAQAGGREPEKIGEAIAKAVTFAEEKVS